jgi:hypothetical protein
MATRICAKQTAKGDVANAFVPQLEMRLIPPDELNKANGRAVNPQDQAVEEDEKHVTWV